MAKWFKRTKKGNITKTTYLDGRTPTTWSQSIGSGSYRQTLTHRGSKVIETITRKMGGYTQITKKTRNKKPKIIKPYKSKVYKFKNPKKIRQRRARRASTKTLSLSIRYIWYVIFFMTAVYIIKAI